MVILFPLKTIPLTSLMLCGAKVLSTLADLCSINMGLARIIVSILQVGKLRPKSVKRLAQITQLTGQSWELNPGSPEASARTLLDAGHLQTCQAPAPVGPTVHPPQGPVWGLAHLRAVSDAACPGLSSSCPLPNHSLFSLGPGFQL